MTDKERLLGILELCDEEDIVTIIIQYLDIYWERLENYKLMELITYINSIVRIKLENFDILKNVAKERAFYLKTYLEGNMWETEENAKKNVQPQIDNAQRIIDVCNRKFEV